MIRTRVITPYSGTGTTDDPYRPLLLDAYQIYFGDITGQLTETLTPDPNAYTIKAVLSDADYVLLEADPRFVVVVSETVTET